MVEAYLEAVAEPTPAATPNAPILRSLRGLLQKANLEVYRWHWRTKL